MESDGGGARDVFCKYIEPDTTSVSLLMTRIFGGEPLCGGRWEMGRQSRVERPESRGARDQRSETGGQRAEGEEIDGGGCAAGIGRRRRAIPANYLRWALSRRVEEGAGLLEVTDDTEVIPPEV